MPRTRTSSITSCPTPDYRQLNRRLRRALARELRSLQPAIRESAARCRAERYRKHFSSVQHVALLLVHGFEGDRSLRDSYALAAGDDTLLDACQLLTDDGRLSVSFSQFAASNTSRPAAFVGGLLPALVRRLRQSGQRVPGLPPDLVLLDSTCLRLSLAQAPWLPCSGSPTDHPATWLLLAYQPATDLPEFLVLTDQHHNDVQRVDQGLLDDPTRLAALRGQTLGIDLGFYSHARFERLLAAGVHVVTRLNTQASQREHEAQPIQQPLPQLPPDCAGRISVQQDQRLTLGSPNNRAGAVLPNMRLVEAWVQPTATARRAGKQPILYRLLTDRWDLSAEQVVQTYLWRWQIELFFRWLKSHVRLPKLLGYSRNAVELTIYLALLVHLLALLLADIVGLSRRSPLLLGLLTRALAHLTPEDMAACDLRYDQRPLPLSIPPRPAPT